MDGVGQGTRLAGRYRLTRLVDASSGGWSTVETWVAEDTTLHRDVAVRLVRGPAAEDVLDAGRRCALVDDPRIQRVLDVGTQTPSPPGGQDGDPHASAEDAEPVTYVVSEAVDGRSLLDLLATGPLPAAEVRAVVGEAASALAVAARSGVHHGALRPDAVLRTGDGRVKVTGVAVDSVARGATDSPDPARDDATGLVALVYAGLTGRWPLPEVAGAPSGLPAAPLLSGHPAPPEDIGSGVPADLDTLCSVVFGAHDDGPRTPEEVVQQLRPWGAVGGAAAATTASTAPPSTAPHRTAPPSTAPADATRPAPAAERAPEASGRGPGRFPVRLGAAAAGAAGTAEAAGAGAAGRGRDDDGRDPFASLTRGDDGRYLDEDPDDPWVAQEEDDDSRSRIVLVLVAVVVVVGLAFALNSLRGFGGGDDPVADPSPPASAPATETPPPAEGGAEQEPAPVAPVVVGVRTLDPQGDDGSENDDLVTRAIDADPASTWNSSTYNSADFGGLKDGVGIVLQLQGPTAVSGATVTMNGSGGVVELRAAPTQSLDDSTVIATGTPNGGTLDLAAAEAVETANVVLWFTELPEVDGEFRVEVGGVQLR